MNKRLHTYAPEVKPGPESQRRYSFPVATEPTQKDSEEVARILTSGNTEKWNNWRRLNPDVRAEALGLLLVNKHFQNADFRNVVFNYVNWDDSFFTNADFRGAAFLKTNMTLTRLDGADFRGAGLLGVQFHDAWLQGADFRGAFLGGVQFSKVDLREAIGLEEVVHQWPSFIDIDTIYRSHGQIPEAFLRGCGVPENLIRYLPSLVSSEDGIQFYSCFISYSSKDGEFAERLHGRMRDAHLRVWFAPEDIQGGKKLHEQIDLAIRVYDKLLIVLSEASLQSEWVMTELRKARKAERQTGKRKLFPVRLVDFETIREWECFDADSGTDLAVELREYFVPDFSRWKEHDEFEASFDRLLEDLRAGTD
jgi:hypothetical protein